MVGKEVYKLRDIQRYCKTKIVPQPIPSIDDVTEIKADKILCQAEEILQDNDMDRLIDIIERKVLEEDYTTLDLAAGLLRIIMGEDNEDIIEDSRPLRSLDDLGDWRDRNYGRGRGSRSGGRGNRSGGDDMARLFINIGKNQNVKPGDILGAIAGESGNAWQDGGKH